MWPFKKCVCPPNEQEKQLVRELVDQTQRNLDKLQEYSAQYKFDLSDNSDWSHILHFRKDRRIIVSARLHHIEMLR